MRSEPLFRNLSTFTCYSCSGSCSDCCSGSGYSGSDSCSGCSDSDPCVCLLSHLLLAVSIVDRRQAKYAKICKEKTAEKFSGPNRLTNGRDDDILPLQNKEERLHPFSPPAKRRGQ